MSNKEWLDSLRDNFTKKVVKAQSDIDAAILYKQTKVDEERKRISKALRDEPEVERIIMQEIININRQSFPSIGKITPWESINNVKVNRQTEDGYQEELGKQNVRRLIFQVSPYIYEVIQIVLSDNINDHRIFKDRMELSLNYESIELGKSDAQKDASWAIEKLHTHLENSVR